MRDKKWFENGITYKQILVVIISLLIGGGIVCLVNNGQNNETITFSTLEFITFITSIIFAAASVILAITAINLGRSSENMMTKRSDESINLQNETFKKTIEVLNRIESSTGVTEKRIEDMISGRVSSITSSLLDNELIGTKDRELIEEEIRKSVSNRKENKTPEEIEKEAKRRKEIKQLSHQYTEFQNSISVEVANANQIKKLKIGEGQFSGSGEEITDIIVEINAQIIGISTFYQNLHSVGALKRFMEQVFNAISKNNLTKMILIFNEEGELITECRKYLDEKRSTLKENIVNNINLAVVSKNTIVAELEEYAA